MPIPQRTALYGIGFIAMLVVGFIIWIWVALHWSYSAGERAGFMQKFSNKGWLCKTWEGELSLVALPGAAPEKFIFTVRDDAVATHINQLIGQRVALTYEQHKGLPSTCFGETDYFVTDIKAIQPQ